MPSYNLPITLEVGALPPNVKWKPQQLIDAAFARASLVTSASYALFMAGSTAPSSNVGPWWRDNKTWYFFDVVTGQYEPQILAPESLGYTIGSNAPDQTKYQVWIETTAGGSPLAVKTYFGGAWVDVYTAVLAPYSTTAQMNTAISNAVAGVTVATYEFRAYKSASPQVFTAGSGFTQVVLDATSFNSGAPFAANVFTAPVAGRYFFKASTHLTIATGSPTVIDRWIVLRVGGGVQLWGKAQLNDLTGGQSLMVADLLDLAAGAVVDVAVYVTSTGASTWTATNTSQDCNFCGWLVKTP